MQSGAPYRFLFTIPLLLCLFFLLPTSSSGQAVVADPVITAPVQSLTINDVDFINSTTPRWLFTIPLRTEGGGNAVATLSIRLTAVLANGENLGDVVTLQTPSFTINGFRSVTNLDLRQPEFRNGGTYIVNSAARRRLEEIALPSGMVPAGLYDFLVTVSTPAGDEREQQFAIRLSNPATVDLLSPLEGENDINLYPLFQWRGDAPSWRFSVFEMLPGQTSFEEAASGIPHLSTVVNAQILQYPASGARSLENGKRYVWFVEGLSGSAGGLQQGFRSELRSFTVAPSGATATPSQLSALLDELERALGPEYSQLFEQIRREAFSPSGTMRFNGSPISSGELTRLLNQLRANPGSITSVVFE